MSKRKVCDLSLTQLAQRAAQLIEHCDWAGNYSVVFGQSLVGVHAPQNGNTHADTASVCPTTSRRGCKTSMHGGTDHNLIFSIRIHALRQSP